MRVTRAALAASTAIACAGATAAIGVAAAGANSSARSVLAGSATPANVRTHPAGAVAGSSEVDFDLVLALRDRSGAQALVQIGQIVLDALP